MTWLCISCSEHPRDLSIVRAVPTQDELLHQCIDTLVCLVCNTVLFARVARKPVATAPNIMTGHVIELGEKMSTVLVQFFSGDGRSLIGTVHDT